jgi:glyoxylase-like metal-dependent hydrolase (beta-lactamase superfamily II)
MHLNRFSFEHTANGFIKIGGGHVPSFIRAESPPVFFDPGVSAFGPFYLTCAADILKERAKEMTIVLTHSHFDHCGAAPYLLRKLPGCRTAASAKAADVLQKEKAIRLINELNAEYEENMSSEEKAENVSFDGLSVDIKLTEGDRLFSGEQSECIVYETPGHTKDCLSFYFPETQTLVAGEAAGVPENGFIHSVFLSDYDSYVSSLYKLKDIDAAAICIAHVGILTGRADVRDYLSASLEAAQGYREMIERSLSEYGGDVEQVVASITAREYDAAKEHIINRTPFMINLRAKINAVQKCM